MDKAAKTLELVKLLDMSSMYVERSRIDDRTYELNGKFTRFHDVSTDGVFYGFVAIQVPNPDDAFDAQLEALVELLTDERIVKGCVKSIVIEAQQDARKVAVSKVSTIPQREFDSRFDALNKDTLSRLKTMEHIREHIIYEWKAEQPQYEDGALRLF